MDNRVKIIDNGTNNRIKLGELKFGNEGELTIIINGNNNMVEIGDGCHINRRLRCLFIPGAPGLVADYCKIVIGKQCNFNGDNIVLCCGEENNKICIGDDCLFARNVEMQTSDNHTIYDINTMKKCNVGGDILVGNHVWFCQNSLIMNNTVISDDTVVAARAVVTKKFLEPNVVLGGVPAKVIRNHCNWDFRGQLGEEGK